jgi:catechol 2,3-dioxygenase-like lactoylglutathione lyase family enzyme
MVRRRPENYQPGRSASQKEASPPVLSFPIMNAKGLTPILNVSDMAASFAWFEKWGWKKLWDWGTPPTFGAVGSGSETCIFLCQGAQGGRGRGTNTTTFQQDGDEEGDKGVWMSVWVDDVDKMHKQCIAAGLEITFPPTDMPWNVREMHLRHPDGHVFRVGRGIEKPSSVSSKLKAHVKKITKRRAPK